MPTTRKSGGAQKALWQTLKFKLVVASTVLILISVLSLTFMFIQGQRRQIKSQLLSRGHTVAGLLAYNARYGVQIGDKIILDKIIGGVKNDTDVVYCIISDKSGNIITSYNENRSDMKEMRGLLTGTEEDTLEYTNIKGEDVINMAIPVELASSEIGESKTEELSNLEEDFFSDDMGLMEDEFAADEGETLGEASAEETSVGESAETQKRVIGTVQLGISLTNMKRDIRNAINRTVFWSFLIFVGGVLLAFWIGTIISAPIKKVVTLLNDISEGEGDLSQRISIKSSDETGDLATGFNTFMDKFQEIKKISVFLNELAEGGGDLTKRLNIVSQDEVGMLAKGFDRFTDKLHEIVCQVAENTEKIAKASQSVSDTTIRLARELDEVASQSGEVAGSSTQISETIDKTSQNVGNVNELMNTTQKVSSAGVDVVHQTRTGMEQMTETIRDSSNVVTQLNESSQKIGEIITAITEIADQTKLISINAAIEASRVGAQGKGFAVVAEEIRRLATRVTRATTDISERIKAIQEESLRVVNAMRKGMDEADRGLELSNRSEESLDTISRYVRDTKAKMNDIAVAANEQSSTITVVSKNINVISDAARQSSEGVSQTAGSMQELNTQVQALKQIVGQFVLQR